MINLAGNPDCDHAIRRELKEAGVDLVFHERRSTHEVPASITGEILEGKFTFRRAWYYWVVSGDVNIETARKMYADESRRDVRVAGHCGSPPPDDWARPTEKEIKSVCQREGVTYDLLKNCRYVTTYHIDTQEGLNFFVKSVTPAPRSEVSHGS